MKRNILVGILLSILSIPSYVFAFEITGYWKENDGSNSIVKITESTILGIPYKLIKKEADKITVIMRGATKESYFMPEGEDAFVFINTNGKEIHCKLLTHDLNMPYAEVGELAKKN